ncbi:alpha/beta fold hydrolase [Jatrophihabitans sp.]|uniref:alpha/beta fold hydrolase n=1 Tax=Jatrophihabitans sp. TaxID=1932789 RepID=UPI002BB38B34|nr:alpha/beta hydrolase [Jatrophihabitans sp.]
MTTTLPGRTRRQLPSPVPRRDRTGLFVAVSLLGAAAGAAVLTLGVLAGAPEHVLTGSTLLVFAAGWGLLALLTARWTDRPLRWALLPAGYLAVLGAGILALAPGDGALGAAGWFWPAGLLALAVWVAGRARHSVPGWSRRWLLYPVCALMALAAVGGCTETVYESVSRPAPAAGRGYDVDGHRMYLRCEGTGTPTVVLASGFGEHSSVWGWVAPALAADTRVCVYDRAGQGWSGPAGARDGVAQAGDLHTLLQVAGVPGPYLLAGHSVGGIYGMIFAARYPDETAGMVLLDSTTPEQFALPSYPGAYSLGRRLSGVLPPLARLGAARVGYRASFGSLPARAREEERSFAADPGNLRAARDEWAQLPAAFGQAGALRDLGAKPLVVLTAGRGAQTGWFAAQDKLATLSRNAAHRTLMDASHDSLVADRRFAGYASQAIRDVVAAVRTGRHVAA